MRIEGVECYVASHWAFVRVITEAGIDGIGEATYSPHPTAVRAVIDDLRGALVGQDAFRPEFLFQRAFKHHCIRDAVLMAALSAVDQALWDIKGKALGVPVWQLLGGRVRDKVRAILLLEAGTEAALVEQAVIARDQGFTAIKIKPFLGDWHRQPMARMMRSAIGAVEAVREAVGWDIDIAIEMHRNLTPDLAAVFAAAATRISPYFLEDPILPYSVAANASVAGRMAGPVAVAERNTNIWEFREFSDCHAVSILRPDVGLAGGFTQLRKIAAIAESRHQRIVPHNFTAPVSTACHIQLAACMPNWDVQGYVREDRDPWNRVTSHINRIENGYLVIPDAPGIGMTLDLEYLADADYVPFGTKFPDGPVRAADGGIKHQ
mgnify:CR=1 FL=1